MTDDATVEGTLVHLRDEELADTVANRAADYTPRAIELATKLLAQRGIEREVSRDRVTSLKTGRDVLGLVALLSATENDPRSDDRFAAADALAVLEDRRCVDPLLVAFLLRGQKQEIAQAAARALSRLGIIRDILSAPTLLALARARMLRARAILGRLFSLVRESGTELAQITDGLIDVRTQRSILRRLWLAP